MKKQILFIVTVVLSINSVACAQISKGVIDYENKINLHRRLTGEREAMKTMVPEFRITNFQLIFDGATSLYKPVIEDEGEGSGSGGVRIQMRQPYSEVYTQTNSRTRTRLQEFLGKTYIIDDSLAIQPWKMDDEIRQINGYNCRMAFYTDITNNQEITAWYTMELPPFIGPENFNTLPGTVLAMDFNNGERVIVAKNISFRELKKNELKKPEKGTKITAEEYRKLVDEQMERMRQNGGGVFIRN